MLNICNICCTKEAKAGRLLKIRGQHSLYSEFQAAWVQGETQYQNKNYGLGGGDLVGEAPAAQIWGSEHTFKLGESLLLGGKDGISGVSWLARGSG